MPYKAINRANRITVCGIVFDDARSTCAMSQKLHAIGVLIFSSFSIFFFVIFVHFELNSFLQRA
jgi:hypothetical protein